MVASVVNAEVTICRLLAVRRIIRIIYICRIVNI